MEQSSEDGWKTGFMEELALELNFVEHWMGFGKMRNRKIGFKVLHK